MNTSNVNQLNNNKGFSLVELIIVVAILAIAAIPLMRSMSMASRVNAKAQSIQNATSLAERVMEEAKTLDFADMEKQDAEEIAKGNPTRFFSGGIYSYTSPVKTATQGEEFIATVTVSTKAYSETPTPPPGETLALSPEQVKVYEINKTKLPVIEDIDTNTQAVLTSSKEFNKYDKAAQTFFDERKAGFKASDPSTYSKITEKTVSIKKSDATSLGGYDGVTVTATVSYKAEGETQTYDRDLYTGTFVAEKVGGKVALDSNIYIFYKAGKKRTVTHSGSDYITSYVDFPESIIIDDGSAPPVESTTDSHRVYFIKQDPSATAKGPKIIEFSGAGSGKFKYSNEAGDVSGTKYISDLVDGRIKFDKIILVTNLGSSGHIYKEEARNRVYDIEVVLTKEDDSTKYATLKSTVTAN